MGVPEAFPCSNVVVVPSEPSTVGELAAPPPKTIACAVSAPEDAHAELEEKYGIPPEVPAMVSVTAPVEVLLVMTVPSPETELTPPAGAEQAPAPFR